MVTAPAQARRRPFLISRSVGLPLVAAGLLALAPWQAAGLLHHWPVLAPAMGFLLQALWSEDVNHDRFWSAVSHLLGAPDCDPVIRSVAARMTAELPVTAEDVDVFASAINSGETSRIV